MKKKIIFCGGGTGGHVMPSIGLTNYFEKKGYETVLITDKRGLKYINKKNLNFLALNIGNSSQLNYIKKVFFYIKIIFSFFNSCHILKKQNPDAVFSLGGYVSFPVCLAAKILNIKILLYEQNAVIGRTNKFFVSSCKKIFTNSEKVIKIPTKYSSKCYVVGNVLRDEILNFKFLKKEINESKKTIIVLGGSQGAEIFGKIIPQAISELNQKIKIKIIQQTVSSQTNEVQKYYNDKNIENYVFDFQSNIAELISEADLAISRCGASTLGELQFLGVPFVAIPYPFAKDNHQYHNADYYYKKECCWMLNQSSLKEENLKRMLIEILSNDFELNAKRKNMSKDDSRNSLLKIEEEVKKII